MATKRINKRYKNRYLILKATRTFKIDLGNCALKRNFNRFQVVNKN